MTWTSFIRPGTLEVLSMINRRRCACERRANSLSLWGPQGLGMELDAQSSRGPVGLSGRLRPVELARKARTGLVPKERVWRVAFSRYLLSVE